MRRRPWTRRRLRDYRAYQREIAGDIASAYRHVWNLDHTRPSRPFGHEVTVEKIEEIDFDRVRDPVLGAVGK